VYSGGTQPECSIFFSFLPRTFLVTSIPLHHAKPLHVIFETNPLTDKISSIMFKSWKLYEPNLQIKTSCTLPPKHSISIIIIFYTLNNKQLIHIWIQCITQVSHKINGTRAPLMSLTVTQLLKKVPCIFLNWTVIPHSQEPMYGPYPQLLNPSKFKTLCNLL